MTIIKATVNYTHKMLMTLTPSDTGFLSAAATTPPVVNVINPFSLFVNDAPDK
jgi:hypothetical protein